jgi:hypothetical protein
MCSYQIFFFISLLLSFWKQQRLWALTWLLLAFSESVHGVVMGGNFRLQQLEGENPSGGRHFILFGTFGITIWQRWGWVDISLKRIYNNQVQVYVWDHRGIQLGPLGDRQS